MKMSSFENTAAAEMKTSRLLSGVLSGVLSAAALSLSVLCATPASAADPIKLRVADLYANTHVIGKNSIQWFMEEVTRRTGGRVQFEYFPQETLAKSADMVDALRSGRAQMANVLYIGNLNPLLYVVQLPGTYSDEKLGEASRALFQFVQTNPVVQETMNKLSIKPVFCLTVTNYQVITNRDNLATLDGLKGMKIMANGVVLPLSAKALGAVPVSFNPNEAYEGLNRGVLDGVALGVPSVAAYKFYETTKSSLLNLDMGGFPVCYAISNTAWASLPPDVQKIMSDLAGPTMINVSQALASSQDADLKKWAERGIKLNRLNAADKKRSVEMLRTVEATWVQALEAKGMKGAKAAIADWKSILNKQMNPTR